MKDKISLIIPAYNSEKVITKCLDSIYDQTHKNIEVIVVNDGSKDGTLSVLKKYKRKHKDLIIIDKENAGQAEARNDGIKKSTGKYMMFIDADDFLEVNYLEVMLKALKKEKADIVISGYKNFNVNYEMQSVVKRKNNSWVQFTACTPWARLYRSDFIKKNNILYPDLRYCEDYDFIVIAASFAKKVVAIENTGYGYYYNTTSLTKTIYRSFKVDFIKAGDELLARINKKYYKNNFKLINYTIIKQAIYYLLVAGKRATRKEYILKHKEVFDWLEANNIKAKIYPRKEQFYIKAVVFIYLLLNKLHLMNLFTLIYCKGKENG